MPLTLPTSESVEPGPFDVVDGQPGFREGRLPFWLIVAFCGIVGYLLAKWAGGELRVK